MSKPDSHYLHGLTWLRAIAALFVIVSHVLRASEGTYPGIPSISIPSFFYLLDLGTFGVLLFFTLSGTTLYISNIGKTFNLGKFFSKRFFRIWPAFAFSIIFYIAFRPIFNEFYIGEAGNWVENQFIIPYSFTDLISYLTLISNLVTTSGLFNNAYWSLPVEFQYYLCFPILLWLVKKVGVFGPFAFGLGLYAIYKFQLLDVPDTKVFMLGFSFCFGVIVGYLYEKKTLNFKLPYGGALLILIFVIAACITRFPQLMPDIPVLSGIWNNYILLATIAVVIVLTGEPKLPKKLKPLFMQLGEISFSLYLWHNLIIAVLLLCLLNLTDISGIIFFYTLLVLTTLITYLVSISSYKFVEVPGMNIGKKIGKRFEDVSKQSKI